ncbi:MAG: DUF4331 domain-containing protein [Acidobacteria bacterium]|nr:DUF4331 domain-containing protein [Acidobacteriota bacterium]
MRASKIPPLGLVLVLLSMAGSPLRASSHMDAPLITLDDAANTTDVYAFRSQRGGVDYLTTALAVYPFEEPGIGPNKYNFDDHVLYEIHLALGDDRPEGRRTISYQFRFKTTYKDSKTILQSYKCPVASVGDDCQNLTQTYTVTQLRGFRGNLLKSVIADQSLTVPPNNQGLVTPFYNQSDNGDNPAKPGVNSAVMLDAYTAQTIYELTDGHIVFAGQRDDGFYADIQSIFDLDLSFGGPNKPFDSQGGYNVHTIVLNIPLSEIGGDQQVVGVYATTSRPRVTVLSTFGNNGPTRSNNFVQVGRQGNPLFCEALVAIEDKDLYNRTSPARDKDLFAKYAQSIQLAGLLGVNPDLSGIFIPDLINVDLSTGPVPLAGDPDDPKFHRLSVFGGDTVPSAIGSFLGPDVAPGGFPNGRRFGDDVVDIAVLAILAFGGADISGIDLDVGIDRVAANDITYNRVFPYAATPLNGRNHTHH